MSYFYTSNSSLNIKPTIEYFFSNKIEREKKDLETDDALKAYERNERFRRHNGSTRSKRTDIDQISLVLAFSWLDCSAKSANEKKTNKQGQKRKEGRRRRVKRSSPQAPHIFLLAVLLSFALLPF